MPEHEEEKEYYCYDESDDRHGFTKCVDTDEKNSLTAYEIYNIFDL